VVPVVLLALLATGAVARADASTAAAALIPIGQVLGWMINLVVAEVLIRRRRGMIAGFVRARSSPGRAERSRSPIM
jgi:hypothetical protein